ncbi:hypothetical protein VNO80_13193 [Phaseolus coccineus]|uniref:Uncharacterized protein n=1 Tax=Phaseolus coccineus TaxID=3886 RepID=A0AAN9N729_PHACN
MQRRFGSWSRWCQKDVLVLVPDGCGEAGAKGTTYAGVLSSTSTRPNQGCYHSEPLHAAVGSGNGGGMKVLAGMGFSGGEGDVRVLPILYEMANMEREKDNGLKQIWKGGCCLGSLSCLCFIAINSDVKVWCAGVGFVGQGSIGAKGIRLLIVLEKQNLNHVTYWVWFLIL